MGVSMCASVNNRNLYKRRRRRQRRRMKNNYNRGITKREKNTKASLQQYPLNITISPVRPCVRLSIVVAVLLCGAQSSSSPTPFAKSPRSTAPKPLCMGLLFPLTRKNTIAPCIGKLAQSQSPQPGLVVVVDYNDVVVFFRIMIIQTKISVCVCEYECLYGNQLFSHRECVCMRPQQSTHNLSFYLPFPRMAIMTHTHSNPLWTTVATTTTTSFFRRFDLSFILLARSLFHSQPGLSVAKKPNNYYKNTAKSSNVATFHFNTNIPNNNKHYTHTLSLFLCVSLTLHTHTFFLNKPQQHSTNYGCAVANFRFYIYKKNFYTSFVGVIFLLLLYRTYGRSVVE